MHHEVLRAKLDSLVAQLELQVKKMDIGVRGAVWSVDLTD